MANFESDNTNNSIEKSVNAALLTRDHIISQFSKIFDSSIILNSNLEIISVNKNTAGFLKCNPKSLVGKSINCFAGDCDLESELKKLLRNGFFTDYQYDLIGCDSQKIKVKLSGFHLGLISDFNELIVLSVQNISSEHKLAMRVRSWEETMDHLIYRAAHDLRGPIASILGLVNVGRISEDRKDIGKILEYIGVCGTTLDMRLKEFVDRVAIKLENEK